MKLPCHKSDDWLTCIQTFALNAIIWVVWLRNSLDSSAPLTLMFIALQHGGNQRTVRHEQSVKVLNLILLCYCLSRA